MTLSGRSLHTNGFSQPFKEVVTTVPRIAPLFSNHSTWAEGAEDFARWLCQQPGVSKVTQGHLRRSHVKNRPRPPEFEATKHSVQVTWYKGGSLQLLFVFAKPMRNRPEGNIRRLKIRLVKAWAASQQRGGVGESPHDEVVIPAHIQRRMAQDATSQETPTAIPPEPQSTLTSEVNMTPAKPLVLTPQLAKAYELLLSHNASSAEFDIEGATKIICDQFGKGPGMRLCRGLQELKLLSRGRVPVQKSGQGRGAHLRRIFTVYRKPYTTGPGAPVPARPAPNPRSPVRTAKGGQHGDPFDHLHWLSKHWDVVVEGNKRISELQRRGVEAVRSRDGRMSLREIKKHKK